MLDSFFGSLSGSADLQRVVSDRGFAKARDKLHGSCLSDLNTFAVGLAQSAGLIERWHGLRVVAADASVLMPSIRACHTSRYQASGDQRLFSLYLPGSELTLHAKVYGAHDAERQMLFEALEKLSPGDVLVLDRGYPAAWLVAHLNEKGIRFCMRCDKANGWVAIRSFMRGNLPQATVTLNAPNRQDALDYECSRTPPQVRLVRQITPDGLVRVMATNLPEADFPCAWFAELYHQRWRIEEAFKRLKHRCKLECVSGLTQHALIVDVAAKVLADNLASLICHAASVQAKLPQLARVCNRSYAAAFLQRVIPRMVLGLGELATLLRNAIEGLARNTVRRVKGRSQPRPPNHRKPHPNMVYKG